jgi:hypothetical protein
MSDPFEGMTEAEKADLFEKRRIDYFVSSARCPLIWRMTAQRHWRTANLAYDAAFAGNEIFMAYMSTGPSGLMPPHIEDASLESSLLSDFFLHSGFALECCLKGGLLYNNPARIKLNTDGTHELDRLIKKHKLTILFREAGISVNAEETALLELIYRHTTWGKYIVPTKSDDMPNTLDNAAFMAEGLNCPFNAFQDKKALVDVGNLVEKASKYLSVAVNAYFRERTRTTVQNS